MAFRDITVYFDKPLFEWKPITETTTASGYTSVLRSNGTGANQWEAAAMPFNHTTTLKTEKLMLNGDVLASYILVIISFFAVIQALKGLVWKWIT